MIYGSNLNFCSKQHAVCRIYLCTNIDKVDIGVLSCEISAISCVCLRITLFVFWCSSQMIGGCGTHRNIKTKKIAGSEKYSQPYSQAIKINSTSESLRTQSHLKKKGCGENGNRFPEGSPWCCDVNHSVPHSWILFLIVLLTHDTVREESALWYFGTTSAVMSVHAPASFFSTILKMSWKYSGVKRFPLFSFIKGTAMHLLCSFWVSADGKDGSTAGDTSIHTSIFY